jgi:hypothetical protein
MLTGNYISYRSSQTELTVADIFREYWAEYKEKHPVTPQQAKVVGSVMACRTPALGGRIDQCQECGAWVFRFNSCRDRHCNQCQKYERARWVAKQKVMQLPIPYFHIVFTVDHALNPLIRANQWAFYNLLFQTVRDVLQEFAKKELKCELGITAVLHTWGQKLDEHIHIHCIVTGGGLALDQSRWVRPKSKKYLFDVMELSAAYRDQLLGRIKRDYQEGRLPLPKGELDVVETVTALRAKKWEVFIKPFDDPEAVYEYLSRYVHQVSISNYRLLKLEEGKVTFEYYENKERAEVGGKGKLKRLTLSVEEFIRRWLSHVLPGGYKRIRYYGLHHSRAKQEKLPRCRQLLGLEAELPEIEEPSLAEWLEEILGEAVDQCPHCGAKGSLVERTTFEELSWLMGIILSLFGQPTRAGVCR